MSGENRLQMFDGRGLFTMPSPGEIAAACTTPEKRERFEAVRVAAQEREGAVLAVKRAQAKVIECVAERDAAETELRRLRPPVSAVSAARRAMAAGK